MNNEAIFEDLQSQGLADERKKYIVFYDGTAFGCGGSDVQCVGTATTFKGQDDRLAEDNAYNKGGDIAIVFGQQDDLRVPLFILHEYAHAMGAVQNTAPHSTGEWHCNDEPPADTGGSDVLCKSDNPNTVFSDSCNGFQLRFDCNNDDYFNPKPEPGSYLAAHWNLGSKLNRFIKFQ